jgi:hypothetical protein
MPQLFTIDYLSQPPIQHKNIRLVPFARTFRFRLPGLGGGFVWSKPVSMLVSYPDGREDVFLIPDQTCRVLLYLLFSGFFGWLAFRWLRHSIIARLRYLKHQPDPNSKV